jgi:hypothetical protein
MAGAWSRSTGAYSHWQSPVNPGAGPQEDEQMTEEAPVAENGVDTTAVAPVVDQGYR